MNAAVLQMLHARPYSLLGGTDRQPGQDGSDKPRSHGSATNHPLQAQVRKPSLQVQGESCVPAQ